MGIYIYGLEMPKNGETITITICDDGVVFEEWKEPGSVFKAIQVPEHGDLIGRDEAVRDLRMDYAYAAARIVSLQPTIIPASTADKEGEG